MKKKILIYSHNPFSDIYNNGKTLKNIFSFFQKQELSQLYLTKYQEPDFSICDNYYCFSDKDALISVISFNKVRRDGVILKKEKDIFKDKNEKFKKLRKGKKLFFLKYLRNLIWYFTKFPSQELHRWIETQQPKILFFVGGDSIFSYRNALFLKKKYNLKLVSYFTDDYLINNTNKSPFACIYHKLLLKYSKKVIDSSELLYVIGELMADDYSLFFEKKFDTLMNCVVTKPFSVPKTSDNIIISFFGGLHLNRWKSLIEFAKMISSCPSKKNICINVYTFTDLSDGIKKALEISNVVIKSPLKNKELQAAINESHILLHLESFEKNMRILTKYSVSTKIPEYLISSKLIIAYGPKDVASIKLIKDNHIGIVLDPESNDFYHNIETLYRYIENMEKMEKKHKYIQNAYTYAMEKFTQDVISKKLLNSLSEI